MKRIAFALLFAAGPALADSEETEAVVEPAESPEPPKPLTFGGYVEAYYGWNFAEPQTGLNNFRGFDNRHNSFTLSNVALDARYDKDDVTGRLTLQVGHTPSTYYSAEPKQAGASGANASDADLWKYVQQAHVGYRLNAVSEGFLLSAGVFLSPIGPESMVVHDNWNWSRSNLFYGLPFYHMGARASLPLSERWTAMAAVYNGWNSVVDNNDGKSVSLQFVYEEPQSFSATLQYFAGNERVRGAIEGPAWRHMIDAYATWTVSNRVSLLSHGNAGFEPNRIGTSWWAAGAQSVRVELSRTLYASLREDLFYEHTAFGDLGVARPIFWPSEWVASGTATLDFRPKGQMSFMLEYRHDVAASSRFFAANDAPLGAATARTQDTLTAGATAWF